MVEVVTLSKFFNQKKALDDVSLRIHSGSVFGLIGPNGAGKTTLIRILNQILEPSSGQILVGGIPLNESHVRTFGYLPEERGLYREMKVLDHLVFLARLRGLTKPEAVTRAKKWLNKFEILAWANRRIDALSKGMAQKVQFIGCVIHDPQIIILDEPLSGFDPLNIQLILNEINTLKKEGKTIVFSTHNMNSVEEVCDYVALIDQGKLIANDPVVQLREAHKTGDFRIRFKGNAIALATALWTDFELVSSEEIAEGTFQAMIRSRKGGKFNNVFENLSSAVELQLIEEQLPGMQDIFVKLVSEAQ